MIPASELVALAQIVVIDIALAGDNAITVGLAAAGLPTGQRHRAVLIGIIVATVLRIILALFAVQLLQLTGLMVAGGLLLLWVAWKLFKDMRRHAARSEGTTAELMPKKLTTAIWQIVVADVSMSLDNVLAVAGVARDHILVLIVGLSLSVVLMGIASTLVAQLIHRYKIIGYAGLAIVIITALHMLWDGGHDFL